MYDIIDKVYIGKRIKDLRLKRKKQYEDSLNEIDSPFNQFSFCSTQDELAKKLGLERRTIISWENGASAPSIENLLKLSNILECNVEYFFGAHDYTGAYSTVALASHFSGISPDIIEHCLKNPDYLDCLNHFMSPDNCSTLFNNIFLSSWKKFGINENLSKINEPFKKMIFDAFDEYSAFTPINNINKDSYKTFLMEKFPENKIIINNNKKKKSTGFVIKDYFKLIDYNSFFEKKIFNYSKFIQYLTDTTFEPLSHTAFIKYQETKLAKAFINLFNRYLEEI